MTFTKTYKGFFKPKYPQKYKGNAGNIIFRSSWERQVMKWLDIKMEIIRESELKITSASTQRLVDVCKKIGADTYVSGSGGRQYMDESIFEKNNLKLIYQDYKHTKYPQKWTDEFIPDLSIVDLLANVGPDSMKVISGELISENN